MTEQQRVEWDRIVSRAAWEKRKPFPPRRVLPRLNRDVLSVIAGFVPHESDVAHMAQVWPREVQPPSRSMVLHRMLDGRWSDWSDANHIRESVGLCKITDECMIESLRFSEAFIRRDVRIDEISLHNLALWCIEQTRDAYYHWVADMQRLSLRIGGVSHNPRWHRFFLSDPSVSHDTEKSILVYYDWVKRLIVADVLHTIGVVEHIPRIYLDMTDGIFSRYGRLGTCELVTPDEPIHFLQRRDRHYYKRGEQKFWGLLPSQEGFRDHVRVRVPPPRSHSARTSNVRHSGLKYAKR